MTTSIEITSLHDIKRTERRENLASIFAGTATVEVTSLNGKIEINVPFKGASSLDAACGLVYRQLAEWGAEVAAVSQRAAGEPS